MPPHLHPRSRFTSSLFATTLFASFFVVALPHMLPCPAPRQIYADDGTPLRKRRRRKVENCPVKSVEMEEESGDEVGIEKGTGRECPIPKPGGIVGSILGFRDSGVDGGRDVKVDDREDRSSGGKGKRPP